MKKVTRYLIVKLFILPLTVLSLNQCTSRLVTSRSGPVFQDSSKIRRTSLQLSSHYDRATENKDDTNGEADRLKEKANELREQIRKLEEQLNSRRQQASLSPNNGDGMVGSDENRNLFRGRSLKNKRVLVVGANGRLGSMAVRYLLRNFPEVGEVVAAVHYVGSASTRGYGRLSYEVGAEDGVGSIGPIWSSDEREATFQYSDEMKSYNLQKLRVVEVELLDPVQCMTITDNVDSVIWCATDFNGNIPRSVSSLDWALLFRAVADVTKGRVEIEGLTNILGGLYQSKLSKSRVRRMDSTSAEPLALEVPEDPISFVLISTAPCSFDDFETPFGEFNQIKRQSEAILMENYPSLTSCVLQMSRYDDNFVQESLEIVYDYMPIADSVSNEDEMRKRRINRRDAARAAVDALVQNRFVGKVINVWTAPQR